MATVSFDGLAKRYRGGVDALKPLSLEVADGEFIALVGPSGCGKSTTLTLLAGLERPSAGRVRIDGVDVTDRSPGDRDIAMVFQSYALYPHFSVAENLAFPLKVAGLNRHQREGRVHDIARLLGLDTLLQRRPGELSGGQRQRVALGRALVRRPKVFLFDEPLSNLDAGLRAQMRAELKRLHRELKATFLYVTHDQAEAMTLADRGVVLNRGEVQQVAPPRVLYTQPSNLFVARFFGTPAINVVAPEVLGLPGHPGMHVGVRPEDLALVEAGGVDAMVDWIEPVGAETFVTVRAHQTSLVVRTESDFSAPSGAAVKVQVRPERVLWFDAASGTRRA